MTRSQLFAVRLVVRDRDGTALATPPKPRPRARVIKPADGGAPFARAGMPSGYRAWLRGALALVRGAWGETPSLTVPVRVVVAIIHPRPASPVRHYTIAGVRHPYPYPWTTGRNRYVGTGGDLDNLAGAVLDALQPPPPDLAPRKSDPPGNPPLVNDRLVVELRASAWYAGVGEEPCAEIRISDAGAVLAARPTAAST